MHVGLSVIFQGSASRTDHEVYADELALARLAEPLGFDSVWSVEHHFTSYTMVPDPLQFLTYMAGCTTHIQLGTMVVVLPWHDPIRVAEGVALLDNLSGGRVILGIGRGLGRVEFGGFGVSMEESRARFVEAAQLVLEGLEKGRVQYEGTYYQQAPRDLRPAPFKSFRDRTYASAVSPESAKIMAELGVGIMIVPQKPWEQAIAELNDYRELYREVRGAEPPPPATASWVFCDPDPVRARELGEQFVGRYYETVIDHYELTNDHLAGTKGYEYYGRMQGYLEKHGTSSAIKAFTDLHVIGTPQQCIDKIEDIRRMAGNDMFMGVFAYGDMGAAESDRNLRLFASEVMPAVKQMV
ncbi:MAG TPA: LLM class flavin-dependent oxidoreductase [Acidimicrobiales bacterium]|nr:LLM class flavin-dependent oxidoreductase [Acidimicrobiales bacterium]